MINYLYSWRKIKLNVFYSKRKKKQYLALNITRNEYKIKHDFVVEYLGCLVDENMSGESMAKMALKKLIIGRIGTYLTLLKECYPTL